MATSDLLFRIIGKDDASSAFLRVAAAAEATNGAFANMGQGALGLTKLVGAGSLIPAVAGATVAIAELGTSLAAAGGALGIFGLSAGGIFVDMLKQQKVITATTTALAKLTPGTAAYTAQLQKLHAQQSAFNQQFGPAAKGFNDMKTAFTAFKQSTSSVTTGVMGKGFELIASVLPKLVPVSNAAGKAVGGLIDELRNWTQSSQFAAVLKWLKDSGPKAITAFGHAIGNIIVGLGGILSNFVGPGDKAAATLDRLTRRFAAWGRSKGVSDSVNRFIQYVSHNSGNLTSALQSLATALPKIASAAGGLGSVNLQAMSLFLNTIAGMPQGVFDVVVKGLFGIAVAAKAIQVASGLTALFTGMTAALTVLGDACLLTRVELGLLWLTEKAGLIWTGLLTAAQTALDIAMDANPIGLVVIAIAALVAGFIIAYKHSSVFRAIVTGALQAVGTAAMFVFNFFKDHWKLIAVLIGGPVGIAAVLIVSNFDRIVSAIKVLGSWGKWLWNNVFQPVFRYIALGAATLLGIWAKMLGALAHVPGFGWVKGIADGLQHAADKARGLADAINKIPSQKSVTISVIHVVNGTVHTTGGRVPSGASGASGGGASGMVSSPRSSSLGGGDIHVHVHTGAVIGNTDAVMRDVHAGLLKLKRQGLAGAALGLG